MKLIQFMFFLANYDREKKRYGRDSINTALRFLTLQWGMLFVGVVFGVLNSFGAWEWLVSNWPYEYGRTHSKNYTTPSAVIAIAIGILVYLGFKFYFQSDGIQESIRKQFDNTKNLDVALQVRWLMEFQIFFGSFAGFMFAFENYVIFIFCLLVWLAAELWIRNKFFSPTI